MGLKSLRLGLNGDLNFRPSLLDSGMDFDTVVAQVVPADLLGAVTDVLVGIGFTNILASQAWERGRLVGRRRRSSVCFKIVLAPLTT